MNAVSFRTKPKTINFKEKDNIEKFHFSSPLISYYLKPYMIYRFNFSNTSVKQVASGIKPCVHTNLTHNQPSVPTILQA